MERDEASRGISNGAFLDATAVLTSSSGYGSVPAAPTCAVDFRLLVLDYVEYLLQCKFIRKKKLFLLLIYVIK